MKTLVATFVLAVAPLSLPAQVPPAAGETLNVTVAEVDVVVLDAKGQPVRGLTRDDFELTVGGRARPISNFYASERAESTTGTPASTAAPPTATASSSVERPSRILFYFDDAHIHQGNPAGLRGNELGPEEMTRQDINISAQRENLRAPMQMLADETGGRLIENENDLAVAFNVLYDHLTTFYSLGFRSDGDGRNEEIRVRVKKPGLVVRATHHVHERTPREELEARVRANLYLRREENPLDARFAVAPAPPGSQTGLRAIVRVPMERLAVMPQDTGRTGVAVFVMLLDQDMNESPMRLVHHQFSEGDVDEAVQRLAITTRPGKYVVSVAVADRYTGEASYFVRNVNVE